MSTEPFDFDITKQQLIDVRCAALQASATYNQGRTNSNEVVMLMAKKFENHLLRSNDNG